MRYLGESRHATQSVGRAPTPATSDQQRWLRVKAVFLAVVEEPPAERAGALDRLCGDDDAVRREVESLLASESDASDALEQPAHALLRDTDTSPWQPRFSAGARLGSYEVTGFIAAGGMGEVYRARHTVLGRVVAIKTLGGDPSDPAASRRLVREAQHAARLAHQNICTIYEVGEVDDQPFIAMEYIDGRSLRELLQDGSSGPDQALRFGLQIADALSHAHDQGIIHRDLKSSNVAIDSAGRAIVLDFGLAKSLPSSTEGRTRDSTLTTHGVLAGTLSYMAPEVLLGNQADVRSDVWALGVLLYELSTGHLPFTGRTSYETSAAILADPPRPVGTHVPLALRLVIERCLAKNPLARYKSASDVRLALAAIARRQTWPLVGRLLVSTRRRTLLVIAGALALAPLLIWGGGRLRRQLQHAASPPIPTLALLPLAAAGGDTSEIFFADGFTDALIAQLGAAANVRVISQASAARLARDGKAAADIAKRLDADMLVQGTLHRTADRVGVELRVVEPERGRVLWSDSYDRDATDVLALQADVVRALALAIRLTMRPEAQARLATVRAVRPDVYEEYLKGRYEWNQRTSQSLGRAMAHFARAVELDPTYAPAHAALADSYNQLGTVMVGSGSPQQFRPLAEAEAIKALQIDPYSAEAHAALGYTKHYDLHWPDAEREFRRAIELNPSYALVHLWYANLLMSERRFDEALREVGTARSLDPFSLIVNTNVAWILDFSGRHEEAIAQLRATLALDSGYIQARVRLVDALSSAGRFEEAVAEARRTVALSGPRSSMIGVLGVALARAGHRDEANVALNDLIALSRSQYVPPWGIGSVYAALGNADSAAAWVERAFDEKSNFIAYLAVAPLTQTLRGNTRFQRVLAQAGYR